MLNKVPVVSNSRESFSLKYSIEDSLHQSDIYTYRIFVKKKDSPEPLLYSTRQIEYTVPLAKPKPQRTLSIPLSLKSWTHFQIQVFNSKSNELLFNYDGELEEHQNNVYPIDMGKHIDKGLNDFTVVVSSPALKSLVKHKYKLNNSSQFVEYVK